MENKEPHLRLDLYRFLLACGGVKRVSAATGIRESTLFRQIDRRIQPRYDDVVRIARIFGVNPARFHVAAGEESRPAPRKKWTVY